MVDHVDWVTLRQFVDPFAEVRLKLAKLFECARTAPRHRAKPKERLSCYHASKRQCCDGVAVVKKPLNPSNGLDVSSHYLFGVRIR
jgi:hypothetical protein